MINNGPYTPGGMIYKQQWGPARHAMNAAFIASQAKIIIYHDRKLTRFHPEIHIKKMGIPKICVQREV